MKIIILGGSGKIGSVVAWDLVNDDEIEEVGLVGTSEERLLKSKNWLKSNKIKIHPIDLAKRKKLSDILGGYDVAVISLPDRKTDYLAVEAVIDNGVNAVDVLEEYHRRPDIHETEDLSIPKGMTLAEYGEILHQKAKKNNLTLIDGIGFAPGLSNLTVGEGIRQLDSVDSAIARVGGIPTKVSSTRHPLNYIITWAFQHVIREYMVKVLILKNGRKVIVEALSEPEDFLFNKLDRKEELECFVTPGMPSFAYTRPRLGTFMEKTIRWPGHRQAILTLKECGLLNTNPIVFKNFRFSPRDFTVFMLEPKLKPLKDDKDACVMWNSISGKKDGKKTTINYYLWEEADSKTGISAMGRSTAFPAAIAARFLAKNKIKTKGIIPPEDCLTGEIYPEFIKELKKRNIKILEEKTS